MISFRFLPYMSLMCGPLLHLSMSTHLLGQTEEVFAIFLFNGRPETNQETYLSITYPAISDSDYVMPSCCYSHVGVFLIHMQEEEITI